jgi:hypothetical protein
MKKIIIIINSKVGRHGLFRIKILTSEIYESVWKFGRTPWTGDQPDARPLSTQDNKTQKNADTHPLPRAGFEPTIPVFGRSKTVRALIARPLGPAVKKIFTEIETRVKRCTPAEYTYSK